jgi:hypothetical protein
MFSNRVGDSPYLANSGKTARLSDIHARLGMILVMTGIIPCPDHHMIRGRQGDRRNLIPDHPLKNQHRDPTSKEDDA